MRRWHHDKSIEDEDDHEDDQTDACGIQQSFKERPTMAVRISSYGRLVLALSALAFLAPQPAQAQLEKIRRIFGGGGEKIERVKEMPTPDVAEGTTSPSRNFPGGLQLAEDREKARGVSMVASQLELKRYAEVARRLGELLEDPATADFFLNADAKSGSRRSFKAELRRLVATLPPEAMQAYELTFGPRARQMLDDAARSGDLEALHAVARRYPHTAAGYEAVYRLSGLLLDQGKAGEALLWLGQLHQSPDQGARYEPMLSLLTATAALKADQQDLARQTLVALKKKSPRAVLDIGGQSRPLFANDSQALAWLADITGLSVKPVTQEVIAEGNPLMKSQTAEFTISASPEEMAKGRDVIRARSETPLPMLHPVAVGDVVLTPTGSGIIAVSLKTGREVWRYPSERHTEGGIPTEEMIWRDLAFGRITTDGQQAFVVEGSYPVPGDPNQYNNVTRWRGGMMFGGPVFIGGGFAMPAMAAGQDSSGGAASGGNVISAIDVAAQGKLLWRVGGPWMVQQLAGAFFLGQPTVVNDRLYVMAELQNSIHLVVLEKATGQLVWMQKLGDIEHSIYQDYYRRMAGASPVVMSGVVVCPTSCGAIVAVDIARRQLMWAYQHPRRQESMTQTNVYNYGGGGMAQLNQGNRWADNTLWVAEGRVIATPLESEDMHCLDLQTGKVLWTRKRGASLYVGCLHNGAIVMVDGRYVNAKKLSNGEMAWSASIQLPGKSRPSGRGVRSGDFYYLPLTDVDGGYDKAGQIARIDLKAGKIVEVAISQRQFVPGNLAFHDGKFISQGAQYLEVFDQAGSLDRDLRQRVASNARDAEAWARLADLERSTGKLAEAIAHLRKAYDLSPTDTIRSAYAAILLDGIERKLPNQVELSQQLARLAK
jgi:outer membrane protein assembly factor BamB